MNKCLQNTVMTLFAGLVLLAAVGHGVSQQPEGIRTAGMDETASGIALYQAGQNEEAVKVLRGAVKRNKKDLSAWHYLGFALEKKGDPKEARNGHEKAAKLGEQLLDLQLEQTSSTQEIPQVIAPIRTQLEEAAKSGERYVGLNPKLSKSKREEWKMRNDGLRGFADMANPSSGLGKIHTAKELEKRARILSKPGAYYTEAARKNQTMGTVVLKVILSAYGKVIGIRVGQDVPDGLTASAIKAARKLKFIPAVKDGKFVSMYAQLEYTFTIY
jgi:TonB family protein